MDLTYRANGLANSIKEDRKKVAILISTVGGQTYKLLKDLCSPDKANTKSFENLVTCLQDHLQAKPTIIVERYKFHQRNQGHTKTVFEFLTVLWRFAANTINDLNGYTQTLTCIYSTV